MEHILLLLKYESFRLPQKTDWGAAFMLIGMCSGKRDSPSHQCQASLAEEQLNPDWSAVSLGRSALADVLWKTSPCRVWNTFQAEFCQHDLPFDEHLPAVQEFSSDNFGSLVSTLTQAGKNSILQVWRCNWRAETFGRYSREERAGGSPSLIDLSHMSQTNMAKWLWFRTWGRLYVQEGKFLPRKVLLSLPESSWYAIQPASVRFLPKILTEHAYRDSLDWDSRKAWDGLCSDSKNMNPQKQELYGVGVSSRNREMVVSARWFLP